MEYGIIASGFRMNDDGTGLVGVDSANIYGQRPLYLSFFLHSATQDIQDRPKAVVILMTCYQISKALDSAQIGR